MAWVATGVSIAGGLYGASEGRKAASNAADNMSAASGQAMAQNQRQFVIGQQNLAPWLQAGRGALTEQQNLMGIGGDPSSAMAALQNSPGYKFRMQQGQNSLDAGLAARGGMGSGKSMQAGVDYNQNFASNEYGNRLAQLSQMSGMGNQNASNMANQGMNFAQNQGNYLTGNANAQGAAGMQQANLTASTLGGIGSTLGNMAGNGAFTKWWDNYNKKV